jgi:hypothetical protein
MRAWLVLLGGLIVWAAHFFALYAVASIFPGLAVARYLTLALTLVAAGAAGWLLLWTSRSVRDPLFDPLTSWISKIGAIGSGLALIAILYQGAPAFLV